MDQQLFSLIQQIHDSPTQAALVVSGGGSQALAWLLGVPGASRTVLEVTLPYSYAAFERYVGFRPEQVVSRDTAMVLAKVAYGRARLLAAEGVPSIGVACTATLITDRPKRGDHRCHVAVRDERGVTTYSLVLAKGRRDRGGEETVVSRLVLAALARACGLAQEISFGLVPDEQVYVTWQEEADLLLQVLRGQLPAITVDINRQASAELPQGVAVLSGAFNPLHGGHLQLAHVAGQILNRPVYFELSVRNVDKPPLLEADVRQRLGQFFGRGAVIVTREPLFEKKAALLPDSVFVVGCDTATRLVHPRYYGDDYQAMLSSLRAIRDAGCRFLVAGRLIEGRFHTLDDVPVPPGFADLFSPISPDQFRADLSSTELRERYADAAWDV